MAAFVLSNLVGLARQILISRAFGTGAELDAFYVAQRLPDILFNLAAGGALASAFIPAFTGLLARHEPAAAWRLASGVMNLVFIILVVTSAIIALCATPVLSAVTGFPPDQLTLAASLLRILLSSSVIFGVSGLLMGILNAHQQFLLPALAPTFYWLGMIFGLLVWVPSHGIYGLAWGAVLGAGLHLVVQLPGLRGLEGRYHFELGLDNPVVREVIRLMGPRLLGVGAVQLNFLVSASLASFMTHGSVSALTYAWQIFTMPQVVIAQSIAIAALPAFSAMVARGELNAMRASLADTLRGILFLALPATSGLWLLRYAIIALLFQGQSFDAASTDLVAWALAAYTVGLVSHSLVEIVSRAFYALKDTRTPVSIGTAAMLLNIGLSLLFAPLFEYWGWPPHAGLALANTVATTLEMFGLLWLMRRRLDGLALAQIWPGVRGAVLAAGLMTVAVWVWLQSTERLPVWMIGIGGVILGGGVYALAAYAFKCPEVQLVVEMVKRKTEGRRQ